MVLVNLRKSSEGYLGKSFFWVLQRGWLAGVVITYGVHWPPLPHPNPLSQFRPKPETFRSRYMLNAVTAESQPKMSLP